SFSRNGGDVSWMNDRKETVIDVAVKANCPDLMQIMASHHGQQLIDRQMKIYNDHSRTTITDGHHSS
ncbi:unnamed protein product, partial [Rotaria socialis]